MGSLLQWPKRNGYSSKGLTVRPWKVTTSPFGDFSSLLSRRAKPIWQRRAWSCWHVVYTFRSSCLGWAVTKTLVICRIWGSYYPVIIGIIIQCQCISYNLPTWKNAFFPYNLPMFVFIQCCFRWIMNPNLYHRKMVGNHHFHPLKVKIWSSRSHFYYLKKEVAEFLPNKFVAIAFL